MPDTLAELRAMPPGTRRAILRALSREERATVIALLGEGPRAPATQPATAIDGHSPWLAALIAQTDGAGERLTPTVRQYLARSVTPPAAPRATGRSLLDAVGGLGMGRRRPA